MLLPTLPAHLFLMGHGGPTQDIIQDDSSKKALGKRTDMTTANSGSGASEKTPMTSPQAVSIVAVATTSAKSSTMDPSNAGTTNAASLKSGARSRRKKKPMKAAAVTDSVQDEFELGTPTENQWIKGERVGVSGTRC